MKTMKVFAVVGCCLGLIGSVACSGTPVNVDPGPQGDPGAQGPQGSQGATGAAGEQGPQGQTGDIACGDTLIPAADWHSACDATVPADPSGVAGVCAAGIEECRLTLLEGVELVPQVMCWDTVNNVAATLPSGDTAEQTKFPKNPVASATETSNRCDQDTTCTGVADNTAGVGTNVSLVRMAFTYLSPFQNSQNDAGGAQTWLPGLCENATEHCLSSGSGELLLSSSDAGTSAVVSCDGFGQPIVNGEATDGSEGVVLADFKADPKESLMGTQCVDAAGSVRIYSCVVDATGVASVQCSGPIQ